MGISNAPDIAQEIMDDLFRDIDQVDCYLMMWVFLMLLGMLISGHLNWSYNVYKIMALQSTL
jgi:hypothetical protein